MFERMKENWKKQWLDKNELKLAQTFEEDLNELKDSFNKTLSDWEARRSKLKFQIEQEECSLINNQIELEQLSLRIRSKNDELRDQIAILEAKATPSNVWTEAFSLGFSKAWDMMMPLMMDGLEKSKKAIEDAAIQSTIVRNNGNHKKNN